MCVYVYIEIKKPDFDNTHCIIIAYDRSINILSPDSFGKRKTSAFLFSSFVLEENSTWQWINFVKSEVRSVLLLNYFEWLANHPSAKTIRRRPRTQSYLSRHAFPAHSKGWHASSTDSSFICSVLFHMKLKRKGLNSLNVSLYLKPFEITLQLW